MTNQERGLGIGWLPLPNDTFDFEVEATGTRRDGMLKQLMDWGGFETPEEAEAFLAQEDPMVELMKWGGFQTVEEAEVFLADLEA
jgi:hypothetical protein